MSGLLLSLVVFSCLTYLHFPALRLYPLLQLSASSFKLHNFTAITSKDPHSADAIDQSLVLLLRFSELDRPLAKICGSRLSRAHVLHCITGLGHWRGRGS